MLIKKNDILTLEIEDLTNLGFGVAKLDGAVIFISGAVTGDVVSAKIIKAASSYYVARVERFICLSEKRETGRCDGSRCQSCAYKALGYGEELKIKKATIESAFIKVGLPDIEICEVYPSPSVKGYRNKAQYPIKLTKDGDYVIGFYAPKSHNVCEAASCPLSPEIFHKILELIRGELKKYGISTYDELSGKGLLRHIYLRHAETTGEVMVCFVINGSSIPYSEEICKSIRNSFPAVTGILLNVNKKNTNVILGDKWITLFGRDYIEDTLAGVKLRITAPSFYQVNRAVAEAIYLEAKRLAKPTKSDTLLDLFCGAGSIGLSMARDAGRLIGIEIISSAIECAKLNAKKNGIENASFFVGDATNTEELLTKAEAELGEKIKPDIIILDPPRAGCDKKLIEYTASLAPKRIVYISCNPQTLARDVKLFSLLGYTAGQVKGYDMFPMTGHVESLVCLTKQTN